MATKKPKPERHGNDMAGQLNVLQHHLRTVVDSRVANEVHKADPEFQRVVQPEQRPNRSHANGRLQNGPSVKRANAEEKEAQQKEARRKLYKEFGMPAPIKGDSADR